MTQGFTQPLPIPLPVTKGGTGTTTSTGTTNTVLSQTPTIDSPAVTTILTLTAGQIAFPATQVPSAGANVLDDYEEGTFTSTYTGATGTLGSTAYATQEGYYTKIGNFVQARGTIVLTNKGSWTSFALLNTLPFTTAAATQGQAVMAVENVTFASGYITADFNGASTQLRVVSVTTAASLTLLTSTAIANGSAFYYSLQYGV